MIDQAYVIARREFLERVRTAWFAIVTLLGPIGMIGIIVIPAWLGAKSAAEGFHIQVLDHTGRDLAASLAIEVEASGTSVRIEPVPPDTDESVLFARIADEEIDGFLLLPEDLLAGGKAIYRGDNATNLGLVRGMRELVSFAVFRVKGGDLGLEEAQVTELLDRVEVEALHTTGSAEAKSGGASFALGYAVMFVLYMAILLYAVNVLRSVVMEKSNRVVEIVVSSVKPRALMLGKVVGVAGVGLFQLGVWALMAVLLIRHREVVLGIFGIEGAGAFSVPPLGAAAIAITLVYFLLGFFFYAALYAAIGAMVNSEQEAQQAQTPLVILLIIPAACVQLVANDPRGAVSEALTQIPFSSPILMPMRYLLDAASPGQIGLSIGILAASTAAAVLLAGRIYRVGILSYGKRPSLRELGRWLRS